MINSDDMSIIYFFFNHEKKNRHSLNYKIDNLLILITALFFCIAML